MSTSTTTNSLAADVSKLSFTPSSGMLCLNGCGKPSNRVNTCAICIKEGVSGAQFCSPSCYRDNYKAHKTKYHKPAATTASKYVYTYPEGTKDGFADVKGFRGYTGTLRAVMPLEPVPKRAVKEGIDYPDYGRNGEELAAIAEKWAKVPGGKVAGKVEEAYKTIKWGLREARRSNQCKQLNEKEIEGMRNVCKLGREVLDIAAAMIKPGVTTLEIDAVVHEECMKRDSYPSPLNYHNFPRSVCTSVNEVICHGIPDARPLEDGDIVNLDVTLYHNGFHGDLNATYPVGTKVSEQNQLLIKTARKCLDEAIRACKPGMEYGKLGNIIEPIVTAQGFSVNKTYVGHGINQLFHCAPNVSHYANNRDSGKMKIGQTFTIEPMICVGMETADHWPDNWTAITRDGKASAQFEETLLVTKDGVEVLTAAPGWQLPDPDAKWE